MVFAGQFMSMQMEVAKLSGREQSLKKDHKTVLSFAYGVLDSFGQALDLSTEECFIGAPIMISHAMDIPDAEFDRANLIASEMFKCSKPNYGSRKAVMIGGKAVHAYLTANNPDEAREKTAMALANILK